VKLSQFATRKVASFTYSRLSDNNVSAVHWRLPLLLMFLLPSHLLKANELTPWKVWKQNENSFVQFRKHSDKGLIEINASLTISSSLSAFIYFIHDQKNIHRWLDNVESAHVQMITPLESISLFRFKAIWPVSKREMLIHSLINQNADNSIDIDIKDISDNYPPVKNYVALSIFRAKWHIKYVTNNTINIQYQFIVDPNGKVPLWLTNNMALRSIWKTLENIKLALPAEKYQRRSYPGIKENHHQ